jgi:hypothetical protein
MVIGKEAPPLYTQKPDFPAPGRADPVSSPPEARAKTARGESLGPAREPRFELAWRESPGTAPWRRIIRATSLAGETALAFALRPASSFRSFHAEGAVAPPLLYGTLLGGPCLLLNAVTKALLSQSLDALGLFRLSVPAALVLLFLVPPLYLFVRAHALHLTLVLTGRDGGSFKATLRLVGYANASVAPLLLIPLAGDFLFLVAGAAVEATGIRFVHGLSPLDAAVAEMIPASILALGLLAVLLVAVIWWSQARG